MKVDVNSFVPIEIQNELSNAKWSLEFSDYYENHNAGFQAWLHPNGSRLHIKYNQPENFIELQTQVINSETFTMDNLLPELKIKNLL